MTLTSPTVSTKIQKEDNNIIHDDPFLTTANNHYAGFGPATANSFRKKVGLKEVVWKRDEAE
jgi:hypothetical protein